ncbi:sensor histidine kinase [Nonomuraea sp. NPDC050556]|uniref:sensor histidine kinase n=1 Tax=Nonomuraea sp. NPDC050556 TaxID=3364369 RepID=UPI0037B91E68
MNPTRADISIAAAVLTLGVVGTYGRLSDSGLTERPLDGVGLTLITLSSAALAWRRSAPVTVGAVAVGCVVAYYGALYPGVFAAAPALIAIYTAATLGRRALSIALAVALALGVGTFVALSDTDPEPGGLSLLSGWLVAMVVLGETVRSRRAQLALIEQRAVEAERTREEAALRRAGEERLWIAQELHDTLTHAISVINVQTAVALQLLERDPDRTRTALLAVKESGQEAMRELRASLGVLRQSDDGLESGLNRLPRLVERAQAVGLPVTTVVSGTAEPLPPRADRAAYRIAQEAFTNVLRHAGPAAITLTLTYQQHTLVIEIEDDGTNDASTAEHGMGLIGMRERAVAAGGTLTAGPRPGGGFAVRAELPR